MQSSWERPPTRHRRNNPSFSSSLLDAIYRSIDESDGCNITGANLKAPESSTRTSLTYTRTSPPVTRLHHLPTSSISSSASASEAESATFPPKPIRTDRIRSEPLQEKNNNYNKKKKKPTSIKKKLQDLKNSTSPKLAGFLNSLFAPSAASTKKQKITADEPSPSPSSASTYSRSCLSKTPSTRGSDGSSKRSVRSVRFCPVGVIVGEDCRKCGEKFVFDGEVTAASRERKVRLMEELMRGFEMEEEDESDGSEDLFELENLGGVSAKFSDELPVYETTDLGMNCAIAKGLVV